MASEVESVEAQTKKAEVRILAFYLPQYYPIPENDLWWGKGFTEWTNVARAEPLFRGHSQPVSPGELGYYDLRVPETREWQCNLARQHGIGAFCYWHYWFGNGRRILERVFNEVVESGKPDFPFCLAWANQTWTGHWHGKGREVLIEQVYGGVADYTAHFYEVLPAFKDSRYIRVEGKPVFLVYNPWDIPDPREFTSLWNTLAIENGLAGVYFIAMDQDHKNTGTYGMNGSIGHEPVSHACIPESKWKRLARKFGYKENPRRFWYRDYVAHTLNEQLRNNRFPVAVPNWDNTPRSQRKGLVYEGSTAALFKQHLQKAIGLVQDRPVDNRLVFIKSWNEWAEGNYLEPDQKNGTAYLEAVLETIAIADLEKV